MTIERIDPRSMTRGTGGKVKGASVGSGADFGDVMSGAADFVNAFSPTAVAYNNYRGGNPAAGAVLSAAFSGINQMSAQSTGGGYGASYAGGGTPSFAGGSVGTGTNYLSTSSGVGSLDPNASVISGTGESFSQMDMINTMNQNNLQLLELQAVMQNNMQSWNTKSNILSADHRARMAMIEKFTARG